VILLAVNRRNKTRLFFVLIVVLTVFLLTNKGFWRIIYPLPYKEIIYSEAAKNNVDPLLVAAIIKSESDFNPAAESSVGARGIMQIMPDTGAWVAKKMGMSRFEPDDLFDANTNIKIGCWYINNLNQEFAGNKILVVAAYNGGIGNVKGWLQKDQWSGEHGTVEQIPFEETREYIKRVLKAYSRYRFLYLEQPVFTNK
jgi:soluble lytic murein transglycosylase